MLLIYIWTSKKIFVRVDNRLFAWLLFNLQRSFNFNNLLLKNGEKTSMVFEYFFKDSRKSKVTWCKCSFAQKWDFSWCFWILCLQVCKKVFLFQCAHIATERGTRSKLKVSLTAITWKNCPSLIGTSPFGDASDAGQ